MGGENYGEKDGVKDSKKGSEEGGDKGSEMDSETGGEKDGEKDSGGEPPRVAGASCVSEPRPGVYDWVNGAVGGSEGGGKTKHD